MPDPHPDLSTPELTDSSDLSESDLSSDLRVGSPTPSVYSLTDSIVARSYRDEYGRKLNNHSDVYRLPADDEEIARLRKQHFLLQSVMGRYPEGVHEVLQDEPGVTKQALDLGCGCGSWIIQVARDFPHVFGVGVDLVPMQSIDIPENCRSEMDDINLGLEHFYSQFDLVHCRLIASGIKDYAGLIEQIGRVLRPNGMAIFCEWDFKVYDEEKKPVLGKPYDSSDSGLALFCTTVAKTARKFGGSIEAPSLLMKWCTESPSFSGRVTHADHWIPASPWPTEAGPRGDQLRSWGMDMRENGIIFIKGARPMLLGSGLSAGFVNDLVDNAIRELDEAKVRLFARIQCIVARKHGIP